MEENVYIVHGAVLFDTKTYPDGRVEELPPVHNVIQTRFGSLLSALSSGINTTAITYMEVGTGSPGWDGGSTPDPTSAETGLVVPLARVAPTSWAYVLGDNTNAANTTSTTTVAPGSVTVTPVSMTAITDGILLKINVTTSSEIVTVVSHTGTTFTATFTKSHGPGAYVIVGVGARVQATTTFGIGVANGTLREVGMYGGETASATLATGNLVNVLRHVAIDKPAGGGDFALTRKLVFQF